MPPPGHRNRQAYYDPVQAQASYDEKKAEYDLKYGGDRKAKRIFWGCVFAGLLITAILCFTVTGA